MTDPRRLDILLYGLYMDHELPFARALRPMNIRLSSVRGFALRVNVLPDDQMGRRAFYRDI